MKSAFLPILLLLSISGINQSFAQAKLDDYFDQLFKRKSSWEVSLFPITTA